MNRVLMIAYHFPPVHVSSGVHRSLYFVRHLPARGWHPVVLTVNPMAYIRSEESLVGKVPPDVPVARSFAVDTSRHLAIKGRHLGLMAVPDRWLSWWPFGVVSGLRLIRRYRPKVLWSTFPIATAHLIGLTLHKLTRLPWVADFRDPMGQVGYPADSKVRAAYWALERKTVRSASTVVLTTPRTAMMYRLRYADESARKWRTIENGYDDELFTEAEKLLNGSRNSHTPVTLVHSGLLYPVERNPIPLFEALHRLSTENGVSSKGLRVVLRASGSEEFFDAEIRRRNLESMVLLAPPLAYKNAVVEMLSADGLLLFQGPSFNNQIPAKAYEYIRARRPVLALTDPLGETAELLQRSECQAVIVPMHDALGIARAIPEFLKLIGKGPARVDVDPWSRAAGCTELSRILNEVTGGF